MKNSAQTIRVMSYNVQVGIKTDKPHHYIVHSWKHFLPHTLRLKNLDKVSILLHDYDIVGLQELDAGSLRSNFINLVEFLAERAGFPFWYHQVNRNLGRFAQHSNGMLCRFKPDEITDIRLPGLIPGRRAIMARFGENENALVVFVLHLSLGKRARLSQLDYLSEIINQYPHAIVMGDMNCQVNSTEMQVLFRKTQLHEPLEEINTFPSWRPQQHIDHILMTTDLIVKKTRVLKDAYSDHLPIVMDIILPEGVTLKNIVAQQKPDLQVNA